MLTKDMLIGKVVAEHPDAVDIMLKHGLHCIGCAVSPYETIEGGAMGHGMTEEQVELMIKELNEEISANGGEKKVAKSGKIIELTSNAAKQIKKLMKLEGKTEAALRFSLAAGGCAGFSYEMEFAENADERDETVESKGIKVFVDKQYLDNVRGTVIDFKESLQGTGFVMNNPNVKTACGCGHSVGV